MGEQGHPMAAVSTATVSRRRSSLWRWCSQADWNCLWLRLSKNHCKLTVVFLYAIKLLFVCLLLSQPPISCVCVSECLSKTESLWLLSEFRSQPRLPLFSVGCVSRLGFWGDSVVTQISRHQDWGCSPWEIRELDGWLHRSTARASFQARMTSGCK